MEMKRGKRQMNPACDREKAHNGGGAGQELGKLRVMGWVGRGGRVGRVSTPLILGVLLVSLLALSTIAMLVAGVGCQRKAKAAAVIEDRVHAVGGEGYGSVGRNPEEVDENGFIDDISTTTDAMGDRSLGGLFSASVDDGSCLSKSQSTKYRKQSKYKPSIHLRDRLRKYEALHKKCAPYTELYNKTIYQLKRGQSTEATECKYVAWISYSGLGNRILSLTSTFLYALLTNRVLLVDRGEDMVDLFCEPFPTATWLLPSDFPLTQLDSFNQKFPQSYGNMLKGKAIDYNVSSASHGPLPAYVYAHLSHDYGEEDKLFFCEQDQLLLQKFTWMVLRSNNYFVPSLFLIPAFAEELQQLFPEKGTVFHHLGRYLFHPTNSVWGLVTRYYQAYLAKADRRLGIQIRIFDEGTGPFQYVVDQIISCTSRKKLLPDVNRQQHIASKYSGRSIAVLLTSLSSGYFEKVKNLYWEHPTVNGDIVSVYQPSHEEYQQTGTHSHNMKAWAEMYLLSLTDALITSSWSTFGYVAQGLAGIKPWILSKAVNRTAPEPHCRRAMSMEPCFHAPPLYDCKAKRGTDSGALVPHVRHCEDMSWGLKVVDRNEW